MNQGSTPIFTHKTGRFTKQTLIKSFTTLKTKKLKTKIV
jgi:hypothetical protein